MAVIASALALMAAAPLPPAPREDRPLPDAGLEARAHAIDQSLRCVVCQNESIAESDAVLAADLRALVRERVAAGDSDDEVRAFMVARYGEFVLMKPRFETETLILWLGPFLVLLLGAGGISVYLMRRRGQAEAEPLSDDEARRLTALLGEDDA